MTPEELNVILDKHKKWLNNGDGGKMAKLCGADLREATLSGAHLIGADLRGATLNGAHLIVADLRGATLSGANLSGADLIGADLIGADLRGATLNGADLIGADLRGATLIGADLDYSCWPLWCGSLNVVVNARIARQLAYHFCRLDCDDPEYLEARKAIAKFANGFHRVDECGRIEA